ncbi:MAG: sulfotransferase family 2 domain-containing protein [Bacteroidales bacterium]|nr:sulfotransferase family 2 domain-containing protein [Bacteroidales bacterium]MDT8430262.1 sulfotransferase family 2 domain-containing protein [Bacteroidales bacterium]
MIVFSHIPKTAGTSLKYILRNNYGVKHIDALKTKRTPYTDEDLRFAKKIFREPQAITGHNFLDPLSNFAGPDDQLITILREPVTRCASHYQDNMLRSNLSISFEEWISHAENQDLSVKIIAGSTDVEKAKRLLMEAYSFTGITEYFDDSVRFMQLQLGKPLNLDYRRLITARNNDIKNRLLGDDASLKLLKKYNSRDAELYDYALNELFLPALETHSEALERIPRPEQKNIRRNEPTVRNSVRFNKFIYRQLIKLMRSQNHHEKA